MINENKNQLGLYDFFNRDYSGNRGFWGGAPKLRHLLEGAPDFANLLKGYPYSANPRRGNAQILPIHGEGTQISLTKIEKPPPPSNVFWMVPSSSNNEHPSYVRVFSLMVKRQTCTMYFILLEKHLGWYC